MPFFRRKRQPSDEPIIGAAPDPLEAVPDHARPMVEHLQRMFPGAQVQVSSHSFDLSGGGGATVLRSGSEADLSGIESLVGMDLNGDGRIGNQPPAPAADDPIAQIERLSELNKRGALSDIEFEVAKRRILEGL